MRAKCSLRSRLHPVDVLFFPYVPLHEIAYQCLRAAEDSGRLLILQDVLDSVFSDNALPRRDGLIIGCKETRQFCRHTDCVFQRTPLLNWSFNHNELALLRTLYLDTSYFFFDPVSLDDVVLLHHVDFPAFRFRVAAMHFAFSETRHWTCAFLRSSRIAGQLGKWMYYDGFHSVTSGRSFVVGTTASRFLAIAHPHLAGFELLRHLTVLRLERVVD
jgi:hypothetical protein